MADFLINQISSFDQIPINLGNTLIICDIDDTLLYFPGLGPNKYNEIFDYYASTSSDMETAINSAIAHWNNLFGMAEPAHTDINGFRNLLLRLHLYNGGICFLTARPSHESNIEFTANNFSSLKLNYDEFKVFYSHTIPKGEYIQTNIDLRGYTNIIFIDDMDHNLINVKSIFGNKIQCYKFAHGLHKN